MGSLLQFGQVNASFYMKPIMILIRVIFLDNSRYFDWNFVIFTQNSLKWDYFYKIFTDSLFYGL